MALTTHIALMTHMALTTHMALMTHMAPLVEDRHLRLGRPVIPLHWCGLQVWAVLLAVCVSTTL